MSRCQNDFLCVYGIAFLSLNALNFVIFYNNICHSGFKQNLSAKFNDFLSNGFDDFRKLVGSDVRMRFD